MFTNPGAIPETTPEVVPMDAIEALLLVQVPPPVPDSNTDEPTQMEKTPVTGGGSGSTVTVVVVVFVQPVLFVTLSLTGNVPEVV